MTSNRLLPFDEAPVAGVSPLSSDALDPDQRARLLAVDPRRNVVLEASAGTGKTRILVDRYLNLLQRGVDPANILAITFTRKAAAEMRQRILGRLREAAARAEFGARRWQELRERAGEVTISTIDAFCLSLLREFPLDADLEPGFTLADETEIPRFVEQALDGALRLCRQVAREQEAVALVFAQLTERQIRMGLEALLSRRLVAGPALARFLHRGPKDLTARNAIAGGVARLRAAFETVDGGLHAFLESGPLGSRRYQIFRSDVQRLMASDPGIQQLDGGTIRAAFHRVKQHFFTKEGKHRQRLTDKIDDFPSRVDRRRHQEAVTILARPVGEALKAFERDLNVVLSRGVWQMFQIAKREYARTLEAHAALDFSEVLERSVRLLQQMDEFARSRYRLESRYHHVLVDEFQDTSRAQWELVSHLVKSWGEGFGSLDNAPLRPSVFIVGDRKQSIYGFRDAEVTLLGEAHQYIAGLRPDEPARQSIARSARAVPTLLRFLNDVFDEVEQVERDDAFRYTTDDRFPIPSAAEVTKDTKATDLVGNVDRYGDRDALGLVAADSIEGCAHGVAREIERLLTSAQVRDRETGTSRRMRHSDVAILFRSRESHREFETALERREIPTYVYKGLGFFDADEVKDVLALLRFLGNPESHTRAAGFLRSRFVRLSDRALQALAPDIAGALIGRHPPRMLTTLDAEDQQVLTMARTIVASWLERADRVPPAELLDHVLAETAYAFELRGRRLVQARENLKKIRAIVRRVQNRGYSTLARLAEHLDRLSTGDEANAIIDAVDAVNLMTVHAAKGLEFPVVFVVNLAKGARGLRQPIRVLTDDGAGEPSVSVGEFESEADEDLKAREREESKRLLYVALTRARDRLYLSAVIKDASWRPVAGGLGDVLPAALGQLLVQAAVPTSGDWLQWTAGSGAQHLMRRCPVSPEETRNILDIETRAAGVKPSFDRVPAPSADFAAFVSCTDDEAFERLSVTAAVSRSADRHPESAAAHDRILKADAARVLIGRLVHRLLQFGGGDDVEDEDQMIRAAHGLLSHEELTLLDDVRGTVGTAIRLYKAVRRRQELSLLSSDACLFEVPFSLKLSGKPAILRGTIDCLARGADGRLTVFEFKTGRPDPDHRAQLDIYVSAIRALFPGAVVEGELIYPPVRS